ncbi:unnamed protein product [Linum trigynum]|uniref:Uncharacterized protein n=1 Tax=Linum trigynum TaxID=586398 RepID=A0AAV2E3D8_9ROSI
MGYCFKKGKLVRVKKKNGDVYVHHGVGEDHRDNNYQEQEQAGKGLLAREIERWNTVKQQQREPRDAAVE